MKTFRTKNPAAADDLVVMLRQMGYVARRSGFSTVEAFAQSARQRSRIKFGAGRPVDSGDSGKPSAA